MDSLALICTIALLGGGIYWFVCILGPAEQKGKRAVDLSGGSISAEKVQDKLQSVLVLLPPPQGDRKDRERDGRRPHLRRPRRQNPRRRCCGVGGPMRAIAAHSRAKVVGITINEYQVNRAKIHNKKAGLDALCEVVCGNFLEMPFDDNSFDGAYSIEATCHAPKLEEVYAEVYRVLKPGALYVSYEWVTTDKFNGDDAEHVEVIQGIERGDALPGLRSYNEIAETARKVGFEVVREKDLASPPAEPWWTRLKMGRISYWRNHIVITVLAALGIAPKGTVDVHEMLFKTADYLTRGGDSGIFSPMHMILCRQTSRSIP
ncbi:sterol methyltransferase 2 [Actinidia rufa]|uniref:Methyltransferase n=1 Tax=Actinidia rufa TaxID=165716 RepID=A0A7J0GI55_9ERIC|nr:sterol methyltransferase 2 [Actinidia rufa]